ncbi:MAG: antibiotic biosynthesis monooxygenase family protein [Pseudomonadota bacterium]
MASPTPGGTCVTVINRFRVPPDVVDKFLAEFERHRSLLSAHDGFLHGTLYKENTGVGRFSFVNVAVWKSQKTLEAARSAMGASYAERNTRPDSIYRELGVELDIGCYETVLDY